MAPEVDTLTERRAMFAIAYGGAQALLVLVGWGLLSFVFDLTTVASTLLAVVVVVFALNVAFALRILGNYLVR